MVSVSFDGLGMSAREPEEAGAQEAWNGVWRRRVTKIENEKGERKIDVEELPIGLLKRSAKAV